MHSSTTMYKIPRSHGSSLKMPVLGADHPHQAHPPSQTVAGELLRPPGKTDGCDPELWQPGSKSLTRPQEREQLGHKLLLSPPLSTTRKHQAMACSGKYKKIQTAWALGEMEGKSSQAAASSPGFMIRFLNREGNTLLSSSLPDPLDFQKQIRGRGRNYC